MSYYPPVAFRFKVKFEGLKDEVAEDIYFQSVSGLSVDIEMEEFGEGGENRFKHKLPVRTKFPNLVLKRGLLKSSGLIKWCEKAFEDFEFTPLNLTVSLYSDEGQSDDEKSESKPMITWKITHALPVKWAIDDLNSAESKIVLETLELSYNYFKIEVNAN